MIDPTNPRNLQVTVSQHLLVQVRAGAVFTFTHERIQFVVTADSGTAVEVDITPSLPTYVWRVSRVTRDALEGGSVVSVTLTTPDGADVAWMNVRLGGSHEVWAAKSLLPLVATSATDGQVFDGDWLLHLGADESVSASL
jgi:hypothetical protein